jgi:hypothetical protein
MFQHPGFIHVVVLVLLVVTLFGVRRHLPSALSLRSRSDSADEPRPQFHRRLALELTEVVLAAVFVLVGGAKLIGRPDMVALFHAIGLGDWFRYLTGSIEVVGAALMIVPLTSGASAGLLGGLMVAATLIELLVLHRPPIAAAACLSGHTYVAWARLTRPRVYSVAGSTTASGSAGGPIGMKRDLGRWHASTSHRHIRRGAWPELWPRRFGLLHGERQRARESRG